MAMTEAVLQILLLLAYLAIGLISVTFPIYAICVTYLKQERWESEKERKQRIEELKGKIHELTNELSGEPEDSNRFEQINNQIKESKKEQKSLKLRPHFLTANGAVLRPVIILIIALISTGFGAHYFYEQDMPPTIAFTIVSALGNLLAIVNLYQTILAVEYAALRPARSIEFDVGFDDIGVMTKQAKLNKEIDLRIFAATEEDDVENCIMNIHVPSQIEVAEESEHPSVNVSKYSHYTVISDYRRFLPKNWCIGIVGSAVPKKVGKYSIKVSICAQGIHENKKELTLNVVK
jgi:hypothetical protein